MSVEVDETLCEVIIGVHCIFQDEAKVAAWMNTKNPAFGNISPVHLFARQRGQKVRQYVLQALHEDYEIQGEG